MTNLIRPKFWTPDTVLDARAFSTSGRKGMELVNLRSLGIIPGVFGGAAIHGTHAQGDVVTQLADGTPLDQVWDDFMTLLNSVNESRQAVIRFLTFGVQDPVETVAQQGSGVDFEDSSEHGVPVGSRIQPTYFQMGYTFKWYDLGARYTWQYLADATQKMVDSVANAAVEAYYRKLLFEVLKCVFNSTNLTTNINQQAYNVYKFYNNDGTVPPSYKNNTFNGTHTHYRTSGAATINAGDLDEIIADFESHGYSQANGYRMVLMANSTQQSTIRSFRSTANGGTGTYDFIPAQGSPGSFQQQNVTLFGASPVSNTLDGLNVIGSYGPMVIVIDDWMPTTHIFGFATGGSESLGNPVGIREHAQANLRGLRLVKGKTPDYPLIDSYWAMGFGTGIRHRGAGLCMEITTNGSYTVPTIYQ